MTRLEKIKYLSWLFSLTTAERQGTLSKAPKTVPLVFGEDGSATDNGLYFLSIVFSSELREYSLAGDGEEHQIARELNAILVTMADLPESEDFIWEVKTEFGIIGISDDLWFVVTRYCKMLFVAAKWTYAVPSESITAVIDTLGYKHIEPIVTISDPRPRWKDDG